jgi:multiple sugar transport system permease protein
MFCSTSRKPVGPGDADSFVWMLSTSLKTTQYVLSATPQFIPDPLTMDSYKTLFDLIPVDRMLANSLIVAIVGTLGQILFSAMAAYAFARMTARPECCFHAVPDHHDDSSQVTLIPLFILMRNRTGSRH